MRLTPAVLLALAALMPAQGLAAGAAPAGALACGGCHAAGSAIPDLAGRPAGEIADAMRGFRAGTRPATVMDRIAKGFSDDESRAIADWIASAPNSAPSSSRGSGPVRP